MSDDNAPKKVDLAAKPVAPTTPVKAPVGASASTPTPQPAPVTTKASEEKSAADMAKETSDAAKSRAAELGDKAKAEAVSLADQGKTMARDKADEAKGYAASEVDRTADQIRSAGHEFGDDSYAAQAADYVAASLSDAADAIRTQDIDGVVAEVSAFARRNPAAFLGGAALLGFAAARMLKSSERNHNYAERDDYGRRYAAPAPGVARTPYDRPVAASPAPVAPVTSNGRVV